MPPIIAAVLSSIISSGRRLVKFTGQGRSDVRERVEVSSYGLDSNPIKDVRAVYSSTSISGQGIVFGYVNTNQKAEPGEFRTFATDADGVEVFYTWMKADGTMEIGGDADNMVRYSELELAFNELKGDLNSHIQQWNTFAAAYVPGGPLALGSPPTAPQSTESTADISGAKIDEIKTI